MSVTTIATRTYVQHQPGWLARLFDNKLFLIIVCLTPAMVCQSMMVSVACQQWLAMSCDLEKYL